MSREIYLDNNATTKPLDEVREAIMGQLGSETTGLYTAASQAHDRSTCRRTQS